MTSYFIDNFEITLIKILENSRKKSAITIFDASEQLEGASKDAYTVGI
jgi:hypothetical protein